MNRGALLLVSSTTTRSSNAATVGFAIGDALAIGFAAAERVLCDAVEAPVVKKVSYLRIVFFYLLVVSKCIY